MIALSAAEKLAGNIIIFFVLIPSVIGLIACAIKIGRKSKVSPEQMKLGTADYQLREAKKKLGEN